MVRRCFVMRRYFLWLLNVVLLVVIIGQVWSIRTCPSMTSPTHCHRYPAGCGALCTATIPGYRYECCCPVYDPITALPIGCCEARCRIWGCTYIIGGGYCEWDIDFGELDQNGNPQVWYRTDMECRHLSSGYPMQGNCQ